MDDGRAYALLERIAQVLREDLREVATRHGLALAQLEVIRYLGRANRFSDTVTGMVDYLGATKGTLSQTVNALERKGLVVRVADERDGRVQHTRLTEAGLEVLEDSQRSDTQQGVAVGRAGPALEALLHDLLRARGGRAFGVCSACLHHRTGPDGRSCGLLGVPLAEDDAVRICREFTAPA